MLLSIIPLFSSSSSEVSGYPYSLAVYHGKILVSYPSQNCIYYYDGDLIPFLHINDPTFISSNNFTIYIISNSSLYYYNGSLHKMDVIEPFMIFYDNYTNMTYVTTYNCYVYELNGSHVINKTYIYESFGYMTFTKYAAIVDSQAGYIFLYYNGSTHVTVNCQDALSAMAFANNYFISGSFSPAGIFIFHNLSVLNLNLIDDVYFYQIKNYNITFIYTVVPDYIAYLNGVLYVASYQGLDAVDLNNSQVFYSTNTPVYSMIVYNGSVYAATPYGILKYDLKLPKIYELTVYANNLIYKGQEWGITINGTSYETTNSSITLFLTQGIYNISISNSWIEKPNVSRIIFHLDSNSVININYIKPLYYVYIHVKNIKGIVTLRINNTIENYTKPNIILKLSAGTYTISLHSSNYSVFPKSAIVELYSNITLNFTATPLSNLQLTSAKENKNYTLSAFSTIFNVFNLGIIVLILVLAIFFALIFKIAKKKS